jgi:hypothetical protein
MFDAEKTSEKDKTFVAIKSRLLSDLTSSIKIRPVVASKGRIMTPESLNNAALFD